MVDENVYATEKITSRGAVTREVQLKVSFFRSFICSSNHSAVGSYEQRRVRGTELVPAGPRWMADGTVPALEDRTALGNGTARLAGGHAAARAAAALILSASSRD